MASHCAKRKRKMEKNSLGQSHVHTSSHFSDSLATNQLLSISHMIFCANMSLPSHIGRLLFLNSNETGWLLSHSRLAGRCMMGYFDCIRRQNVHVLYEWIISDLTVCNGLRLMLTHTNSLSFLISWLHVIRELHHLKICWCIPPQRSDNWFSCAIICIVVLFPLLKIHT